MAAQVVSDTEKEKPVFIAAVSESSSLELQNNINVCGTSDQVNTEAQAKLISKTFPIAQTVAILFNPSERNSLMCVERMQESLETAGLKYNVFGVSSESEIEQTIARAAKRNDVLLLPLDNFLAAAMPTISKEAIKKRCPLVVSDIYSVTDGALLGQGTDHFDLGKKTADVAYKVLFLKESPGNFGVTRANSSKIVVNKRVADALQFNISTELTQFIAEL